MKKFRKFTSNKKAASLTGYALIVGLISIIAIFSITNLGEQVKILFTSVGDKMTNVVDTGSSPAGGGDNLAPTAIDATPSSATILSGIDTGGGVVVASVSVTDDANGTNILSVSGDDSASFSFSGTDLIFDDGVVDFDTPNDSNGDGVYEVVIEVDDSSVGVTPDATSAFTVTILDNEIKITASDAVTSDDYGISVGLSGTNAVVGADVHNGQAGAVYFYDCSGGACVEDAILTASDAAVNDVFGTSVAIDGTNVLVGAFGNDIGGISTGSAYLFDCSGVGCSEVVKFGTSDAAGGDNFSRETIGISGTNAFIGAFGNDDNGSGTGSAYYFDLSACGSTTFGLAGCEELDKILASDAASGDSFGFSTDISGTTTIAGAYTNDITGSSSGAAYVFDCSTGNCTELARLTPDDPAANDLFGRAVAISGNFALVAARHVEDVGQSNRGAAYMFNISACNGSNFDTAGCEQTDRLMASDGVDEELFASSVDLDGPLALVGSPFHNSANPDTGAAYLFDCVAGVCTESLKFEASDAAQNDQLGFSVAISSNYALAGANNGDKGATSNTGAAYLFALP